MRPHPRTPLTGSEGTDRPGGPSHGQSLLREGTRRIRRLLERSPAARRPGFKADPPGPKLARRRDR